MEFFNRIKKRKEEWKAKPILYDAEFGIGKLRVHETIKNDHRESYYFFHIELYLFMGAVMGYFVGFLTVLYFWLNRIASASSVVLPGWLWPAGVIAIILLIFYAIFDVMEVAVWADALFHFYPWEKKHAKEI